MIHINVINRSTVVNDADGWKGVRAVARQISEHFYPAWGVNAKLYYSGLSKPLATGPRMWELIIVDDADQAGALGYHDLTSQGMPIGYVFAKTTITAGLSWTVTLSHELLEMLADPDINLTAFIESDNGGRLYAYEVADAPEADENGYLIDGVLVSDFVYPEWFESFWPQGGTQFDYQKKITAPLQLLPGGYIGYYDVPGGNGWQQLTADKSPKTLREARARIGSRRERRRTPRELWQKSTAIPLTEVQAA